MNHLEIDWNELAERMPAWRSLRPMTRHYLLGQGPGDALAPSTLRHELERLEAEGFVHVAGTGRITFAPGYRALHRAMRAMDRYDLEGAREPEHLHAYLADQYTAEEREALLGDLTRYRWNAPSELARKVTSAAWLREALASPARAGGSRAEAALKADTATLLQGILEKGGSAPLDELFARFEGVLPPSRLGTAIGTAVSRVLLLATLDPETRVPVLRIWGPAAERLQRPEAVPPVPEPGTDEAGLPFLLHDIEAVLLEATSEPLRLRADDGSLFARAEARVEAALVPLPEVVAETTRWSLHARLNHAIQVGRALGFLGTAGVPGKDLRLQARPEARAWLGGTPSERIHALLDLFRHRPSPSTGDPQKRGGRRPEGANRGGGDRRGVSLFGELHDPRLTARLEEAAVEAFRSLPENPGLIGIGELARYHGENRNPLLGEEEPGYGYLGYRRIRDMSEEEREEWWAAALVRIVEGRLLPLGGAVLGWLGDPPRIGFRLTGAGRYLLGLEEELPDDGVAGASTSETARQVVVQPNFEVVFLAPFPGGEAELARLAERISSQRVGSLFRITRASVFQAAAAGMRPEEAQEILESLSLHALPPNVRQELEAWFGACRVARAGKAYLLRFDDEESATRALAAAGQAAVRLSPTVLELVGGAPRAPLVRKLRSKGIFLDREAR